MLLYLTLLFRSIPSHPYLDHNLCNCKKTREKLIYKTLYLSRQPHHPQPKKKKNNGYTSIQTSPTHPTHERNIPTPLNPSFTQESPLHLAFISGQNAGPPVQLLSTTPNRFPSDAGVYKKAQGRGASLRARPKGSIGLGLEF